MAATPATHEMLLYERPSVTVVFGGVPPQWPRAAFRNMLTAGGFLVSAVRRRHGTASVQITAQRAGVLRLRNPWPTPPRLRGIPGHAMQIRDGVLHLNLSGGATVTLQAPRRTAGNGESSPCVF